MADYLSGTTTKLFFAGIEVGEITGLTKDPSVTWSENDFLGTPVKQFIPIKTDAVGTIDRFIPDWQMLALSLGYTYYDTVADHEVFESGDVNPDILWRYIEFFDLPYDDTSPLSVDTSILPEDITRFTGRMELLDTIKLRMRDGGTITGIVSFEIVDSVSAATVATFDFDTSSLTVSFQWFTITPVQTVDLILEREYIIRMASTTGSGTVDLSKSLIYNALPNIRSAFVVGFKQSAFDEGFEIRIYNNDLEGNLKYIEKFTGVIFHRSGIEITANELTSSSLEWYAGGYLIYKA